MMRARVAASSTLRDTALSTLHTLPRLQFGAYPTPIEELVRLRAALGGGPRLFIKRDDYLGFAFGGNKLRKLEYLFARILSDGAEVVVTTGTETSNHARTTAGICARLGLQCVLVLSEGGNRADRSASLYLDELFGASVHRVKIREERNAAMDSLATQMRQSGRRVAVVPLGGSIPEGAVAYVAAVAELAEQMNRAGLTLNAIFHSSSSGGTQAGLEFGCQMLGLGIRVIGVSPDDSASSVAGSVAGNVFGIARLLGVDPELLSTDVTVLDGYVGAGYGIDTVESLEAIQLLARTEGILLDSAYTAKAMAALIGAVRSHEISDGDNVLFWHTGGQLAMFCRC